MIEVDEMTDSQDMGLREQAVAIFHSGLEAVAPDAGIKRYCQRIGSRLIVDETEYALDQYETIYVVGAGKAGAAIFLRLAGLIR